MFSKSKQKVLACQVSRWKEKANEEEGRTTQHDTGGALTVCLISSWQPGWMAQTRLPCLALLHMHSGLTCV